MKVSELIEKLKDLPQDAEVKLMCDIGVYADSYYAMVKMNNNHIDYKPKKNEVELGW